MAQEKKTDASVFNKHNEFVRTYTVDAHGPNFKDLAEGYAKKIGGTVR